MSVLILPGRGARGQRPRGPFRVNGTSAQAEGLLEAYAGDGPILRPLLGRRGVASQRIIVGSTFVLERTAGSEHGVVPQTEINGASGEHQRVLDTGLPGLLDGLSAFTIAYWVYPLTVNGSWWGQAVANSTFCETNGSTTGPFLRGMGYDGRGAFTEVATTGAWQHLAWTVRSGGSVRYYRNGVLQQTAGAPSGSITAADTNGLYVGGQPSGSGGATQAIDAQWADFRVYSRELSAPEIWALYDPATRWDLYWVPGRTLYFDAGAAVVAGVRNGYYLPLLGVA